MTVGELSPPSNLRRLAVRGGAIFLAAKLATQAFQWTVTLLVARLLVPEDYAMMTMGTLFLQLADVLGEVGIGRALVQKHDLHDNEIAQGFTVASLLSMLAYAGLFVLAPVLAAWFGEPGFTLFLRVLALTVLLLPLRAVCGALLERRLQLGRQSMVQLGGAFLQAAVVLSLAWHGFGYWALATSALLSCCFQTVLLLGAAGWRVRLALPTRQSWTLVRYGLHVSLGTLFWIVYSNADYAVIRVLFDGFTLGSYSLAFELMSLPVQKFSTYVNQVMFSLFSRFQHEPERLRDWYLRLIALLTFLAAPVLIGLGLVAADGLPLLLGPKWSEAVLPFQILCPVGVLMIVSTSLVQFLGARGHPEYNARYNGVCAIVYPLAFWFAGRSFGLVGVCLVWPIVYPLMLSCLVHFTRHSSGISLRALLVSQRRVLLGCALMTAVVLLVNWLLRDDPRAWLRLVAMIGSGVLSYAAVMLMIARKAEIADLGRLARGLR
jgi:teichuronic acid exporter